MANQKRNIQMKFFRLGDHGRKGLILQHLRGNVIIGGLLQSGGVGILRYTEQVWLVAQGGHIGGVQGKLVLVHDVDQLRWSSFFVTLTGKNNYDYVCVLFSNGVM